MQLDLGDNYCMLKVTTPTKLFRSNTTQMSIYYINDHTLTWGLLLCLVSEALTEGHINST